jgi:hypothetical protein
MLRINLSWATSYTLYEIEVLTAVKGIDIDLLSLYAMQHWRNQLFVQFTVSIFSTPESRESGRIGARNRRIIQSESGDGESSELASRE